MELFHVLSRGVDKRKIFLDDQDRFRFIHNLFEFNNQENSQNNSYFLQQNSNSIDIASRYVKKKRKLLVNIHAFCLMDNHYHLLLSPKVENGIPKFMKKLNIGHSKYFNIKYQRSGALFEGRYKCIPITQEAHFLFLPYYIHLNPLDYISPEWRERELKNINSTLKFLNSYRWSSHLDYSGKQNFPSVTQRDFLLDFFEGPKNYEKGIKDWLKNLLVTEDAQQKITLE